MKRRIQRETHRNLALSNSWYGYRTFDATPPFFAQLYTIHYELSFKMVFLGTVFYADFFPFIFSLFVVPDCKSERCVNYLIN